MPTRRSGARRVEQGVRFFCLCAQIALTQRKEVLDAFKRQEARVEAGVIWNIVYLSSGLPGLGNLPPWHLTCDLSQNKHGTRGEGHASDSEHADTRSGSRGETERARTLFLQRPLPKGASMWHFGMGGCTACLQMRFGLWQANRSSSLRKKNRPCI